jgi:hypothetical protein
MPIKNGLETCIDILTYYKEKRTPLQKTVLKQIREINSEKISKNPYIDNIYKDLPLLVVLSSHSEEQIKQKCWNAGFMLFSNSYSNII